MPMGDWDQDPVIMIKGDCLKVYKHGSKHWVELHRGDHRSHRLDGPTYIQSERNWAEWHVHGKCIHSSFPEREYR